MIRAAIANVLRLPSASAFKLAINEGKICAVRMTINSVILCVFDFSSLDSPIILTILL